VIDGSMLGYLCDLGHIGVAVEGGQHDDPQTVECHESALLLMLVAAGALAEADVPDLRGHYARLAARTASLRAFSWRTRCSVVLSLPVLPLPCSSPRLRCLPSRPAASCGNSPPPT
jgi:hypothetical protein